MRPLVDHADEKEERAGDQSVAEHLEHRSGRCRTGFARPSPACSIAMWLTDEYAISFFMSFCAMATSAP